ncbi:MAG: SPOR domain-containing protein [Candidatus Omnitrophota bacterium]
MKKIAILIILLTVWFVCAYAASLDTMKVYFLNADYKAAILEGEKLLAGAKDSSGLDELYYLLGLSYLKDGNYLRASDIFEIMLYEIKPNRFKEEAKLALGDTYLLRKEPGKAQEYYLALLQANPATKLRAQLYYRLSKTGFDTGNAQQGAQYREKLKKEFPSDVEALTNQDICYLDKNTSSGTFYTVQVGYFANPSNARNLTQELASKGYPAYTEEAFIGGKHYYRVMVGKSAVRRDTAILADKLSAQGYPTKICP